jgi:hypothetical protein
MVKMVALELRRSIKALGKGFNNAPDRPGLMEAEVS